MENKKDLLTINNVKYLLANLKQLTFEVTDSCNLRCKYCGYGELYDDYDKRENKMLYCTRHSLVHCPYIGQTYQ